MIGDDVRAGNGGARDVRYVFVSDLHLTATGFGHRSEPVHDARAAAAFEALVRALARDATAGRPTRLVLLGDTFDLIDRALVTGAPVAPIDTRLHNIAERHASIFEAVAGATADGLGIDVVAGNHDAELAMPEVQRLVRGLIAGTGGDHAVAFHPWILYVAGLVYAEHGHQYHDLNAFRSPLAPSAAGDPDRLDQPVGAFVDAALRARPSGRRIANATAVASAIARYLRAGARAGGGGSRSTNDGRRALERYAGEVGLPASTLRSLDGLSRRGLAAVGARAARYAASILRMRAARTASDAARDDGYHPTYLRDAVREIDAVLRRADANVPFYVFGHSHVVERVSFGPAPASPVLFGTGTWTAQAPYGADVPSARGRFPSVDVRRAEGLPTARIALWDGATFEAAMTG